VDTLSAWKYYNLHTLAAPSYFQEWFVTLKDLLWDELSDTTLNYRIPLDYETFEFLVNQPEHPLIDNQSTNEKEGVDDLVQQSFESMTAYFNSDKVKDPAWQFYNRPSIVHLMGLEAFSRYDIPIGGSENSINATNTEFGPSWRMIVQLNEEGVKAFGVYPGGPSGNPADPNYQSYVDAWAEGRYFPLPFFKNLEEAKQDLTAP
jgi:penicillin amidase